MITLYAFLFVNFTKYKLSEETFEISILTNLLRTQYTIIYIYIYIYIDIYIYSLYILCLLSSTGVFLRILRNFLRASFSKEHLPWLSLSVW